MSYASMTKAQLITELESRDARIVAAVEAYKALRATVSVKTEKRSAAYKEVMRFETKDALLSHYGASVSKFLITRDGEAYVANTKVW